ncbi:TPA: tyrosine-type recombinase/integrase [Yersinia enterocolitica]|nr:tyrosine-type recombinase/integrase [Yersinia enterocolitica]
MSIKSLEGGRYKVDIRPRGTTGRRIQRIFDKKADAVAFERYVITHMHDKDWLDKPTDHRRLSELLEPWWTYKGRNLKHGEKRRGALLRIVREMCDPMVFRINKKFLLEYRSERLYQGVKASTINRDITVLSGMFNVLIEAGEFHAEHPIRVIKPLKEQVVDMCYLDETEIAALLNALDGEALRLTILCLSTGGRWGEASNLKAEHIMHERVTFMETKNGKKRTVPISPAVMKEVKTKSSGRLFNVDYATYRKILRSVKPDLPRGQGVHVLRHTFAAHFMINGGNIITLQRIMGHANIMQTMTYAHLAPDYLNDATLLNPLKGGIHIPSTV